MKTIAILLLLALPFAMLAQDSTAVDLHLDKLKMTKGESIVTTVAGALISGASGALIGVGAYQISEGNNTFGGALVGTGGVFLGTGLTMSIIGGRKWRLHVKYRQGR